MRPTGRPAYHTGFLSTLSLRRATASVFLIGSRSQFLSTLSLRRATRTGLTCGDGRNISIHALLAESDKLVNVHNNPTTKFLSTLSLRRATAVIKNSTAFSVFLSTLSLRRATSKKAAMGNPTLISIHALLAESDTPRLARVVPTPIFLSTLSLRRATHIHSTLPGHPEFLSTLSLRRATSVTGSESQKLILHFYPRSPCGERRKCFNV